ncbi:hypothetical protein JTB14_037878 [Gonioctena quinquepunctata]|nr:hypothetical protein JTB14_037878 [Gonioctena quinquepunctata]
MAKVKMDLTILKRDFAMFGKMHQFIAEYANKTLLQKSAKVKEIENKDKLKKPGYEILRKNFEIMKKSDKDDFDELIEKAQRQSANLEKDTEETQEHHKWRSKEKPYRFDPDYEMEFEILDQMEILDPELWEKYRTNRRNLEERYSKDTKPTKKEVEKGEAPGLTRAAGAPSLPPHEAEKRAEILNKGRISSKREGGETK